MYKTNVEEYGIPKLNINKIEKVAYLFEFYHTYI